MFIYLIRPVYNNTAAEQTLSSRLDTFITDLEDQYVADLEQKGHQVFQSRRNMPQDNSTMYELAEAELVAIKEADEVHVYWDAGCLDSHFALGMCYALNKNITFVQLYELDDDDRSYVKMVEEYSKKGHKNLEEEEAL